MATTSFSTVAEYLAAQPPASRRVLARVRSVIRKAVPRAVEGIAYQMPAYKLEGRAVVYFAGWKQHYSLYPVSRRIVAALAAELAPYDVNAKGTLRFPLSAPVPVRLIAKITKLRIREVLAASKA